MGLLNWSGGLQGAGEGVALVGHEFMKQALVNESNQLANAMALKRDEISANRAQAFKVADEARAPALAGAVATATADATAASTVRNAPGLLGVETTRARAINEENTRAEVDRFEKLAPIKRKEEIATAVEKVKALATPEMLKYTRAIALADHIVDPMFSLVPNADGTVRTFDARSGKTGGVMKDADGQPIIHKDPEELKAAVSVINLANTNLRIAEAAYKADATSIEPGVKEKSAVAWADAQREAKQMTAPAYALLYNKAKIPGVVEEAAPVAATPPQAAIDAVLRDPSLAPQFRAKYGVDAPKGKATTAKPNLLDRPWTKDDTTFAQPGTATPADDAAARRRAAAEATAAADAKAADEARTQRLRDRQADEARVGLMNRNAR